MDLEVIKGEVVNKISEKAVDELKGIMSNRSVAKKHLSDKDLIVCARVTLRCIVNGLILKVDWDDNEKESPTRLTTVLSRIGEGIDPDLSPKNKVHVGAFMFDCAVKCGYVSVEVIKQGNMSTAYPARTADLSISVLVKKVRSAYPDQYVFGEWTQPYNNGLPIVKKLKRSEQHLYTIDTIPKVYKALNLLGSTEWEVNGVMFDLMTLSLPGFTPDYISEDQVVEARKQVMDLKRRQDPLAKWIFEQKMLTASGEESWINEKFKEEFYKKTPDKLKGHFKRASNLNAKTRFLENSFDHTKIISEHSKMNRFFDTMAYCGENLDSTLKFTYNLDSRGRIYSVMGGISPQGSDMEKSLIHFKNGAKWSDKVRRNLAIHTANCAGQDKLSFDDRAKWAEDNMGNILEAHALLNEKGLATEWLQQFANEKKTKWQLISAIMTWGSYHLYEKLDAVDVFKVHISIGLDATTSGLQILSILGRDETVAEHVNIKVCSYAPVGDLYQVVGDRCHEVLHQKVVENPVGVQKTLPILGRMKDYKGLAHGEKLWRKIVKRGAMTFGYSCGSGTMGEAIYFDRKDHGDDFLDTLTFRESSNFGILMFSAIQETLPKADEIMRFLQDSVRTKLKPKEISLFNSDGSPKDPIDIQIEKKAAKDDVSGTVAWTTPSGFRAYQRYENTKTTRVETRIGGKVHKLTICEWLDSPNRTDHKQGIAANFVHSLDSALLVNTVCRLGDMGYTEFHFVHDQFGLGMDGMEDINEAARYGMYDMFSQSCPLEDFCLENGINTTVPQKGTYNIEDIKEAIYSFC